MHWLYVELYEQLLMKNYPITVIALFGGRDLNDCEVLSCYLARYILEFHFVCNFLTENIVHAP